MRFTREQENAIYANNRELLVSAAAGSGKTAVLVQRILHLVADLNFSIDKMLVVTYTRAAAAELRERLETLLNDAALDRPDLQKQAELIGRAQISTIHAYCQRVIRENFKQCRVDPQFTIGDQRSLQAMYQDSMEETLDALYTLARENPAVNALVKKLPEKNLVSVMDELYKFLISRPEPTDWLKAQAGKEWRMETIDQEPIALAFVNEGTLMAEEAMGGWARTKALSEEPCFLDALKKSLNGDYETLNHLYEACGQGFSAMTNAINQCKFVTLSSGKPTTSDEIECVERYKALRAQYKKTIEELKKLLPTNLEASISDMNQMTGAMTGLSIAVQMLMDTYRQKKLEQATLDFNDLEHMTLEILKQPDLKELEAQRFDAVFVDEYQDVSAIQEGILNSLKRPADSGGPQFYFYVGDVKQSIYRFRLAEPRLFLDKLESFSEEADAPLRKIILNKNFRSREGVLDAVNRAFLHVMDKRVTEITYDRAAMLYPGGQSTDDPITELHVCTGEKLKPIDVVINEAAFVAKDILSTVGCPVTNSDGTPGGLLHYRDIALLLPVMKNVADKVEAVLTAAGIPVYTDAGGNGQEGEEIIQAVHHLRLLDNLMNDTALISELRSPLFDMSEQELAAIRLEAPEREASFLTALQKTAENGAHPLSQRCSAALQMLDEERFLLQSLPPDEYLWDFLMRSGLYVHYGAQPGGKLRQANLRMLCKQVGEFALSHRDGLQGLLESIQSKAGGDNTSPTVVNPWEDVVRIMSIHKSKGLEFPTAYLMGLGNGISKRRTTRAISMHGELGMGLMYMNEHARTKRVTLMQNGIQLRVEAEERAEKARLLYVAMTRPKNRLVMIGSLKGKKNGLESALEAVKVKPNEINDLAAVRSAGSLLDWLTQCVDTDHDQCEIMENTFSIKDLWNKEKKASRKELSSSYPQKLRNWRVVFHIGSMESTDSYSQKKVNSDFFPNLLAFAEKASGQAKNLIANAGEGDPLSQLPDMPHLPLKLGVTALCQTIVEKRNALEPGEQDEEETVAMKRMPLITQRPRLMSAVKEAPAFMLAEKENLGALRGSLTHRLLSQLPLRGLREAAAKDKLEPYIKEEIIRMTGEGIWTEAESALADTGAAADFFRSDIGARMLASGEVHREWSFNLRVHAPMETIVQGVIDLCFLENGRWVLIDFKTDQIKTREELWQRYGDQIGFYRMALEKATAYPVGEAGLYSLKLRQAFTIT